MVYGAGASEIMRRPAYIVMEYLEQVNRQLNLRHYEETMASLVPHLEQHAITRYFDDLENELITEEQREQKRKANIQKLKSVIKKINTK